MYKEEVILMYLLLCLGLLCEGIACVKFKLFSLKVYITNN